MSEYVVPVIICMTYLAIVAAGLWHGNVMFERGIQSGRELEAMDAKHAREMFVKEADKVSTIAWMKAELRSRR